MIDMNTLLAMVASIPRQGGSGLATEKLQYAQDQSQSQQQSVTGAAPALPAVPPVTEPLVQDDRRPNPNDLPGMPPLPPRAALAPRKPGFNTSNILHALLGLDFGIR